MTRLPLDLDLRQRAMLQEMGVRVWQPMAPAGNGSPAAEAMAERAAAASAKAGSPQAVHGGPALPAVLPPAAIRATQRAEPAHPLVPAPAAAMQPDGAQAGWRLGSPQPLYPESAQAVGVRWLVLAQAAPGALQSPAFEGDAGRLLDNMLRAARLHQGAGAVVFAPLVRQNISGAMEEFTAALTGLMAHVRPDAVLVMGRLAAQALLASSEPLGKLRGQPHTLHGRPAIVTYDAPYLLRCPHDKAKAWDDLCLAVRLAAG